MGSSFDDLHDASHDEQHPTNDEQRATHLVGTARVSTGATDGLLAVALALSGDMSGAWVGGSSADIDKDSPTSAVVAGLPSVGATTRVCLENLLVVLHHDELVENPVQDVHANVHYGAPRPFKSHNPSRVRVCAHTIESILSHY